MAQSSGPEHQPTVTPPLTGRLAVLAGLAVVLVGFNLRAALAALSPVLHDIITDLGLSAGMASALGTAPVFCLGLFAPAAPFLARRLGTERIMTGALLVLAAGAALRGLGSAAAILAGGLMVGAAVALLGTLSPALIKRDFTRVSLLTGLWIGAMAAGATFSAGLTVPAMHLTGSWGLALALWALPALAGAGAVWAFVQPRDAEVIRPAGFGGGVWGNRLAWQVTAFMGLQSGLNFCGFIWLPALLTERGLTGMESGVVQAVYILVQAPIALASPLFSRIGRDQRLGASLSLAASLAGFLGCIYLPVGGAWFWSALLGIGQAANFCFAMMLIILRAPNARIAAELSGMAQGAGYLLAGLSPLLMGVLHDQAGGWELTGPLVTVVTLLAFAAVLQAGRARTIKL